MLHKPLNLVVSTHSQEAGWGTHRGFLESAGPQNSCYNLNALPHSKAASCWRDNAFKWSQKIQCTEKGVCSLEDLFGGTGSIYLRAYTSCMQVFVILERINSLTSSPSPSCLQQTVECIVWDAHSSNKSLFKFQWPMPCRKHQFQFELCCWAALGLG